MAIVDEDDKYEQPTITQIVHALVIYGLVVIVGFFLLIGLANNEKPEKATVKVQVVK